ncbi:hypothetical protein NIES2135_53970 [Leptolyngbya boryana NIES-2135]|jgi:hypothetical protein|uniref:Uncharacterized protein n=1 Tax=Leptolyngbya boryana NIES-2135 TaxID=1973484 RepID=A0A1Z4JP77_LEPBY|nr:MULTISPECIES: hypothetical protein [Leptolyngbya]BAY58524.1 hypothetical protein NIES2135_53970 [Leptolyngbya boryana NIES-2135]MBD2370794.1 hypothetical protein [Leptolyngbya sp. FACHB-161]MBD2377053.1 hypothetical protein [Leptolyngbya sp. FACHB-238]MBD2401496.1 hypothetical protein [Leptolyngbya sp. FACHB-239]MBD2408048.1 hypothetical protein [Leptolyngbya sp. FACHB-402]
MQLSSEEQEAFTAIPTLPPLTISPLKNIMNIEEFRNQMQYLALRFPDVSAELIDAYYEFLKDISAERFTQVCKSIFCDWTEERFPAPIVFIEEAIAISHREALSRPPSPEVAIGITDSEWLAASRQFFATLPEVAAEAEPKHQRTLDDILEGMLQRFHDLKRRLIAIKWAKGCSDIEIVTDEQGNAIDLRIRNNAA